MKNIVFLIVCILLIDSYHAQAEVIKSNVDDQPQFYPVRERMLTKSLNGTWKFKIVDGLFVPAAIEGWEKPSFSTSDWDNITVPGNWETQGFKKPEYRYTGEFLGLYRTQFKFDPAWKGKHVILRFDGVYFGYECFLNGHRLGEWGSATNLRQFDISPFLNTNGENVLSVLVSTRSKGWEFDKNDCWAIAGITRDVELFTLDNIYFEDITYVSDVSEDMNAKIKIDVDVNWFEQDNRNYRLNVVLSDPLNNHVLEFSKEIEPQLKRYHFEDFVNHPKLWTAETPNLYRMEVFITNENGLVVQRANERVGIRSVCVEGFDLKVNHKPILLRGICVNEIDPKLGRALTYKERHRQLEQMKDANINFIRTAHYPFGPDFLNLCDEMGFYVAEEVPFGHGDENLDNEEYLPELIARAEATLRRDKNHASVILWTLGNENPYTDVVEKVIVHVKEKDPTRPRGLPQKAPTFTSLLKKQSKNVDIYMGHYLNNSRIQQLIDDSDKPVIMTEYAHSLGLSFNDLEDKYNRILKEPKIIGGAIWDWQDQALLTDGSTTEQSENQLGADDGAFSLPIASAVTQGVWIDSVRYMDNFGDQGTDGVVYADGYPQEDFFQVRKVYSPVVVTNSALQAELNSETTFNIEIENRFDFIPLNGYRINWSLRNLNTTIDCGTLWLHTGARMKDMLSIKVRIPQQIVYNDLMLCTEVLNPSGKAIYERNLPVEISGFPKDYYSFVKSLPENHKFSGNVSRKGISARIGSLQYSVSDKGVVSVIGEDGKKMVESPLYLRVGRKVTVTLEYQGKKNNNFYWNPYLLEPIIESVETSKGPDYLTAKFSCKWLRGENPEEYLTGNVIVKLSSNGIIQLDYDLDPSANVTGNFMELGLTLKMNPSFDTFRWLGNGPFTTTPDKNAFNDRAIWKLHRNDLRFIGNRGNVDIGVLTGTNSEAGVGLWSNSGNIGVECIDDCIYVSQNLFVSSYGNKFSAPNQSVITSDIHKLKGSFVLFIDEPSHPATILEPIFKPYKSVVPEQPYLKSYGW